LANKHSFIHSFAARISLLPVIDTFRFSRTMLDIIGNVLPDYIWSIKHTKRGFVIFSSQLLHSFLQNDNYFVHWLSNVSTLPCER